MSGEPIKAEAFIIPNLEALLKGLKLERPELAQVRLALECGDVAAAEKACVDRFRSRAIDSPLLEDRPARLQDAEDDVSKADRYLNGQLFDGYNTYDVPPTGIDWKGCPLSCITRFPIFPALRSAIRRTGDPRYARFIVDHVLAYQDAYPIEGFVGTNTDEGWVTHYQVSRPWYWGMVPGRLREVSISLLLLRESPEVTDEELLRIIHRLHEETAYLRHDIGRWIERRSNAACALILSMAAACVVLEDFVAVDEWLEHDARLLARYIDDAFYPDGQCIEQTTAYSSSVAFQVQNTAYALREQKGIRSARDKLSAMVTWAVAMSKPTGWLPSFGDNFAGEVSGAIYRPILEWLSHGWGEAFLDGAADPPFTVWPEPGQPVWCGYHTMRSDWSRDARFMAVDCGPWGTTHRHGDRLSFVLSAFGADFIIDPTATRYASNEPDAFLSRQEASFLHNIVTVDGVDEFANSPNETKEPLDNRWEHGEAWSLFVGSTTFAPVKPVVWERRILFVDRAYWILQDLIRGDLPAAELEQNFQFQEGIEITLGEDRAVAVAPNGARLAMLQLSGGLTPGLSIGDREPRTTYWPDGRPHQTRIAEDGERPPSHGRGWTGRWGHRLLPAPALTCVGKVDLPSTLTVAMVPIAPGGSVDDLPRIAQNADGQETVWELPCSTGAVRFVTSVEGCEVRVA